MHMCQQGQHKAHIPYMIIRLLSIHPLGAAGDAESRASGGPGPEGGARHGA